ncbi:MAG: hypothetical protein J0I18_22995, partial [Actinobacteria bacterium]|nr:hypothetical protein [Actinomycetota bacterium]
MSTVELEEGAPRVRMGRRERNGVLLGLTAVQILIASVTLGSGMLWMLIDTTSFWGYGFWPVVLIVVFAVGSYHRQSFALITFQVAAYYVRVATGQHKFIRDIWGKDDHVTMKKGRVPAGRTAPTREGHFDLPGANAGVVTYQTDNAGAFTIDEKARTAAITVELVSSAWAMEDRSQQKASYDGFVAWLSSLETIIGLVEMTIRVRVDAQPATEMAEYVVTREAATARAFDPISFTGRMRATSPDQRVGVLHPPVMGIHEHRDRIEIDGSIHQVLWIAEWPRTERNTGFMERLLYATDTTRTLTLQIRPVETEKALQRIARHKTGLEMANILRERRGMPRSAEKDREM